MRTVTSGDGTTIAYTTTGSGPAVVLVGGAFCARDFAGPLPELLSDSYTVYAYDRRGRGDSTDTQPYAVERELEDLRAVIDAAGGQAHVYGVSSGAILAFEAAAAGLPIRRLVMVEPPYTAASDRGPVPNYAEEYERLCAEGNPGAAVELFMTKVVGQPQEAVEQARQAPMWPALEALAPTLAYDARITGDGTLPADRFAKLDIPVLAVYADVSPPWLQAGAKTIAETAPLGELAALPGQFHQPEPGALAAAVNRFLG
ncbi:alpha/beta hydrolase [Catellatospora sp. NPDC049609]|uniref:alpha/beta fold hydrolase n=1 Tax=Catellatospora sp. NPDC049609 TaxID=3155505 RepID=UPI0034193E4B